MKRKVFYSFHYEPDNWRVSQIRNIGSIEGNKPASGNDWESITAQGDQAIKDWISDQMAGRSCTLLLVGEDTADRKWINYEIIQSWNKKKGIVGIHIHNLKNSSGEQASKGSNPFNFIDYGDNAKKLSCIVKCYDPPYETSKKVYNYISDNIEQWIEEAIQIRKDNDDE